MTMHMSILSARAAQSTNLKIGGKIRPGIKLLTNNAKNNPKAVQIYESGVRDFRKFSDIEKDITAATNIKNPLYPRNTQHFNIAASDFGMPEIAELLLKSFGEIRDANEDPKLYRFPIVFHSDALGDIFPNKLVRHGGKPGYESVYLPDGLRYCQFLPEVTSTMFAEQKAQRIKKVPRREKQIRGLCEPGQCPEYQQGQCKFSGRLHFYIPGVPTGLVSLETSSEYAAEGIWSELSRISEAFGHIPRVNTKKPGSYLYYLTKVLEKRTYFDENGQEKTGMQWVPKLEADLDIGSLMLSGMAPQARLAASPVAWLAAPAGMPSARIIGSPGPVLNERASDLVEDKQMAAGAMRPAPELDPLDQIDDLATKMELSEDLVKSYLVVKLGATWYESDETIAKGLTMLVDLSRKGNVSAKLMMQIAIELGVQEISIKDFMEYAVRKYKQGYQNKPEVLQAIHNELVHARQSGGSILSYFKAQFTADAIPA
ncbi:hypothetical protein LPN04_31610 [Rugamonas sp. A1-17]|nr:hypothetical protein [Rugamonas sp. A1-17]